MSGNPFDTTPTTCFRATPDFRISSGHRHEIQEEVFVLGGGGARAKVGGEILELEAWDAARVLPEPVAPARGGAGGGRDRRLWRAKHREPRRRDGARLVDVVNGH